jgi:hypothetical protein
MHGTAQETVPWKGRPTSTSYCAGPRASVDLAFSFSYLLRGVVDERRPMLLRAMTTTGLKGSQHPQYFLSSISSTGIGEWDGALVWSVTK